MDVREKLVELIEKASYECDEGTRDLWDMLQVADGIADFLIANGVTVQQWISVKDRLPDTAERVLVCRTWLGMVYKPVYGYYQDFPNQKGCWYILTEEGYYPQKEVTHWMPLPEPPIEEQNRAREGENG